jgi:hypothetical protein
MTPVMARDCCKVSTGLGLGLGLAHRHSQKFSDILHERLYPGTNRLKTAQP